MTSPVIGLREVFCEIDIEASPAKGVVAPRYMVCAILLSRTQHFVGGPVRESPVRGTEFRGRAVLDPQPAFI